MFETKALNKYRPTPIVKLPTKSSQETSQDGVYWKGLQFPISVQESGPVKCLDICPTSPHYIAVTGSARVQVYNPESNSVYKTFTKFKEGSFGARFRSDGKLIAAGTEDGPVKMFDLATKTQLRSFKGHGQSVQRVDFMADLKHVVSFSDDQTVRIWDIATEEEVTKFEGHKDYVRAGCASSISPDIVISGSYDHTVKLWDKRRSMDEFCSMTFEHGSPVESVLLMPNDALLISAGGHEIKIWDILAGSKRPLKVLTPHNKTITCLGFSNSKTRLVSGSLDAQIRFHDLTDFKMVHALKFPSPILTMGVAPDDSFVAAGMTDGLVQFLHRKVENEANELEQRKLLTKKSAQYYLRFTEFTPKPGDIVIEPSQREHECKHDYFLRKFEHAKALDCVLKPFVVNKKPQYAYSVLEELKKRQRLKTALGGRNEKSLAPVLRYLTRYINDYRFSALLCEVSSLLLDLYMDELGKCPNIDRLFVELRKRVDREVINIQQLLGLHGALDMVMKASLASEKPVLRMEESAFRHAHFTAHSKEGQQQSATPQTLAKYPNLTWNKVLLQ